MPCELTFAEAQNVCGKVGRSKAITVQFSGGEPLVREDFFLIAGELHEHDMLLSLESNGWLLNSKTIEELVKVGVMSVKVSLDGVRAETHDQLRGLKGSWERAVQGIKSLIDSGIKASVGFCPVRFNIQEIDSFVDFCVGIGISQINTGELAPQGRGYSNWEQIAPLKGQYDHFFATLDRKSEEYKREITLRYTRNIMGELSKQWGSPPAHLLIAPSGKIRMSGLLPFVFGNVRDSSMDALFQSYLKAWRMEKVRTYLQKIQHMKDFLNYPGEIPFLNFEEELTLE